MGEETTSGPAAVTARGISMTGPWGQVFGPLDIDIQAGGVTVLVGPPGSGRTALLMNMAGRMTPSAGTLTVFGHSKPRQIFAVSALAGVEQLDAIYASVTVRDLITEQCRWDAPWYRIVHRAREADRDAMCTPVFGDLPLPQLDAYVEQLDELTGLLLRIALANTRRPALLVVGNIDEVSNDADRRMLIQRLVALGHNQTVITASSNQVPEGLGIAAHVDITAHVDIAAHADTAVAADRQRSPHGRHEKRTD